MMCSITPRRMVRNYFTFFGSFSGVLSLSLLDSVQLRSFHSFPFNQHGTMNDKQQPNKVNSLQLKNNEPHSSKTLLYSPTSKAEPRTTTENKKKKQHHHHLVPVPRFSYINPHEYKISLFIQPILHWILKLYFSKINSTIFVCIGSLSMEQKLLNYYYVLLCR